MKIKKIALCIAVLGVSVSFYNCATLFGKSAHPVTFASEPVGVEVYLDDNLIGKTPVKLELKANKSYTVKFKKEGSEPITRIINNKIGVHWVILDVLGGLIPIVVDAATGNWYKLDTDKVHVTF